MSPRRSDGATAGLLKELVNIFGPEKVLSEPEDLYVYSHDGAFGTKRQRLPLAILRLKSDEEDALQNFSEKHGVHIVRDEWRISELGDGEFPIVFIDTKPSTDSGTLMKRLSELEKDLAEGKQSLKELQPLPQWYVSSLRVKDGYRIGERDARDKGFCVVQPFFDGIETYSSKGRLLLSRGLLSGELEASERLVDSLFSCTACSQCYDQLGGEELEINHAIIRARHEISKAGEAPSACRVALMNIHEEGNPMGMPAEDRTIWWEDVEEDFPYSGNDVLYWPGCTTAFRLPGVVEATVKVFDEAELDFGVLGVRERCCGLLLYLNGQWDEATESAYRLCHELKEAGVRQLVTNCAGCYYTFSRVYPILGIQLSFGATHTSQVMEGLIDQNRIHLRKLKRRYTWHDPCDLGRHSKVFEAPRNVLRSIPGLELEEPLLNREHTICCGAGGGLWMYDSDLSERVARSKLEDDVSPLGVDGIVTGCPACVLSLRNMASSVLPEVDIMDLSEVVSSCL